MKGNYYRKLYRPDYFGWYMYCQHAAVNRRRSDKSRAKKLARLYRKKTIKMELEEFLDNMEGGAKSVREY